MIKHEPPFFKLGKVSLNPYTREVKLHGDVTLNELISTIRTIFSHPLLMASEIPVTDNDDGVPIMKDFVFRHMIGSVEVTHSTE